MAAPVPDELETRLFLALDDQRRFVIMTHELYGSAGDLLADVMDLELDDASVHPLSDASIPAVVSIPTHLDTSHEAVEVLRLFTKTSDDLVQSTGFYVTPQVAETGGCRALALALAGTVEAGERELATLVGPRTLRPGLGLNLPDGFHLTTEGAHDFSIYRVHAAPRLRELPSVLSVYVGGHPSSIEDGGDDVAGLLLGQPVQWQTFESEDAQRREVILQHPNSSHLYLHVFIASRSSATMDQLLAVAESLTIAPQPRSFPPCADQTVEPSNLVVEPGSDLDVLMRARSFAGMTATWLDPNVAEAAAFRSLMGEPSPAPALRHLALTADTVEGRLYGLAGLRVVDEPSFVEILCAVRDDLPSSARTLTACGSRAIDVETTIESDASNAIRGEPHWRGLEWDIALAGGTADIRGGGLGHQLIRGDAVSRDLAAHAARLGGTGYIPPLRAGDESPSPLVSGRRGGSATHSLPATVRAGGCGVRHDGRVACWGGERPAASDTTPSSVLLPDVVRFPRDLSTRFGAGCMLDDAGTRVCWDGIEESARLRAEACGAPPTPSARLILQRHDDGPWERLVESHTRCGIHRDGSLHCFVRDPSRVPQWATYDRGHRKYRIPIEGRIMGSVARYNGAVTWTDDGRIFAYDQADAPHQMGHFDNLARVSVGLGGAVFAQLVDGRVFAHGAREPDRWYESFGRVVSDWQEVPALRGAHLFLDAYHGCALFEGGLVSCFGKADGFDHTVNNRFDSRGLTSISALNGATTLVVTQRRACGLMSRERLTCVGVEAPTDADWNLRNGVSVLDLRRALRRARELTAR